VWWYISTTPPLQSLRQEDLEFKAIQDKFQISLGYIVTPCLKKKKKRKERGKRCGGEGSKLIWDPGINEG
jgi:hypothetical protein